jgi:hypothetical protein
MFAWLMRLIWWLLSIFRRRKTIDSSAPGLAPGGGYQRPRDPHPRDPLTGVRQPVARRPGGNSAAVAVEEPEEDESLTLVGAAR